MKYTNKISSDWSDYNKTVATCQLDNNGVIFLDQYDCPIDNEYEVIESLKKFNYLVEGSPIAYRIRFYLSAKEAGFVSSYEDFQDNENYLEYFDGITTLEGLGKEYISLLFSLLEKGLNRTEAVEKAEWLGRYINLEKIGEDAYFDKNHSCCFSTYGFVRIERKNSHIYDSEHNYYIIDNTYVLSGLKNAFNGKKSYWLSKKDCTLAVYCFSDNNCFSVEEQLKNIDGYIAMFESKRGGK